MAEQIINTIYLICEQPDILCAEIIKRKTVKLFDLKQHSDDDMEIDMAGEGEDSSTSEAFMRDPNQLSQLIFIAGHVAIKQIVHLEAIELEWKRQKVELGKHKSSTNSIDDELEQVTGTSEDDIYEVLMYIREQELLYGSDSLLSVFGPLVVHICSINKSYNNQMLQVVSTLTLTKFMCVSSKFCEDNLQLLFTILEKTNDPTIKCNIIIALGDMTVCFNNVIDQHINYLYNRLSDDNTLVKKNALMVLTHLILNGMIKAKDQLIEMHKCLGDDDQRISDLAKLFFSELETKDNAVIAYTSSSEYNVSKLHGIKHLSTRPKSMRAIYGESYNSSNNNTNSTLNDQTNETTVFDEPSESLPSSPTTPLDLHLSSSIDADITTTQSTPNNFNLAANPTSTIFNTKSNKNISEQNPQIKFLIGVGAGVVLIVIAGLAFFFVNLKRRNSSNNGKTIQQLKRSTSSGDWKRKSKITFKDTDEKQYPSESTGFIESESLPKPKSVDLSTSITITQQKDESEKIPDLSSTSDSGVSDIPLQINPIGSPREHSSPIYSGRNSPYHSPSHSGDQLDKTLYLESIGPMSGSTGLQTDTSPRETTRPRTQPYQIMTSNDPNIPFRHSISSVPLHHQIDTDASSRETTRPRPQSYQTTSSSDPSDVSFRHDIASIPSGYHQQQQQQAEHPSPSPALPGATRLSRSSASRGSRSSNNPPSTQSPSPSR
ncbi:3270_t:CDS:2 [Entrophospora sp. SA101]|nr:3270_t:CDS:2 [Entrophospora sp. SA101]